MKHQNSEKIDREKIIVIGTGKEAEIFLYNYGNIYEVVLFADDNPRRNSFRGKSVVLFESILHELDGGYKIIIATSLEEYISISRRLQVQKLLEFRDFIYYKAIKKKIAIFFGNCQCQDLRYYAENIKEFSDKYWVYPYPAVYGSDYWYIPACILENCDLFVYQAVKEATNGYLKSSDYLVSLLKAEAIKIRMPNLFRCGKAWYLQSSFKSLYDMRETEHAFVVNTDNHDRVIKELYDRGFGCKEIAEKIRFEQIWDNSEIIDAFNESMNKIQEMDQECDINIYEYIKENYKSKLIFTDPGHVSNDIYQEYLRQLMVLLNIDITMSLEECLALKEHAQDMPIYGCISRCLGLSYVDKEQIIKKGSFVLTESTWGGKGISIEEYVEQYIYICVNNTDIKR